MMRAVSLLLMLLAASPTLWAQPVGTDLSPAAEISSGALKVFLDCKDHTPCYGDYVKTEIAYVDYVIVREAADVHVLVTSLGTGSGGREYTLKFVGLGDFKGVDDEVLFGTLGTDTEEINRRGFVQTLKLGLVRYALHTGLGTQLQVNYAARTTGRAGNSMASRSSRDPWNYWVLRARLNSSYDSEASSDSVNLSGSLSANRTTAGWKISVAAYQDYRENNYTFSDGTTYKSTRRGHDVTAQAVKSLTTHWSAGAKAYVLASTYENKDRVLNGTAAVEYNLFPYTESTRRQLTLQYLVGVTDFDYLEETVYGKLSETLGSHAFRTSFDLKQTWGSLSADFDYWQYMKDRSLNRRTLSAEADIRLFKGLALTVSGRTSSIHDQLYLKRGEATDEEVLAHQRQLATSFRRSVRVGISYTFGSIFSNVVNTRLSNLVGG